MFSIFLFSTSCVSCNCCLAKSQHNFPYLSCNPQHRETFKQTIELNILKLCKQSSLFAKNIIRRKFSWFQIEKIRLKSHRLSVSELAISGFWDLEIINFRSPDIRAKFLICTFERIRSLNFPQDIRARCFLWFYPCVSCNCRIAKSQHNFSSFWRYFPQLRNL